MAWFRSQSRVSRNNLVCSGCSEPFKSPTTLKVLTSSAVRSQDDVHANFALGGEMSDEVRFAGHRTRWNVGRPASSGMSRR